MATRHLARTIVLQSFYEWDFYKHATDLEKIVERNLAEFGPGIDEPEFVWKIVKGIIEHLAEIDAIISRAAPEWPIDQIAIIDRNVLRLGLYELLHADRKEVPPKVAINEAIEIAKSYGGVNSPRFVNGVLGTVFREIGAGEEAPKVEEKETEKNTEPKEKKHHTKKGKTEEAVEEKEGE